ncbi:MAG: chloramphenicol resistance protein, partial [Bacteroides sp.]|nr:chloramphenicol resistance protein [Bacteroides sp.]
PQLSPIPMAPNDWQMPGSSTFAGGVSDSLYGVSAYAYNDTLTGVHTGARKAWFFFDNEVVCLGTDIHSTATAEVNTTVNQCLLAQDKQVLVCSGKSVNEQEQATAGYRSPQWVLHNNVAYLFPNGGQITVSKQTQSGTWHDINRTTSKDTVRQDVFTLNFEHGMQPAGADYAYIVVPGKRTAAEVEQYRKHCPVSILSNTPWMQVVRNKELKLWGMVFYTAGTFKHKELQVTVDRPCTLLIKEDGTLHIADPGQTQEEIQVSLRLPALSKKTTTLHCDFKNSGIQAGATKAYRLHTDAD